VSVEAVRRRARADYERRAVDREGVRAEVILIGDVIVAVPGSETQVMQQDHKFRWLGTDPPEGYGTSAIIVTDYVAEVVDPAAYSPGVTQSPAPVGAPLGPD
jgi:hypothetical protein